jgi:hypothetical protein
MRAMWRRWRKRRQEKAQAWRSFAAGNEHHER